MFPFDKPVTNACSLRRTRPQPHTQTAIATNAEQQTRDRPAHQTPQPREGGRNEGKRWPCRCHLLAALSIAAHQSPQPQIAASPVVVRQEVAGGRLLEGVCKPEAIHHKVGARYLLYRFHLAGHEGGGVL